MKKIAFLLVLVLLFSFSFTSCMSTQAVQLGVQVGRPITPWGLIAVYRTADDVPGTYEEVALISCKGETFFTNEKQMINSMKKKASACGANSLILDSSIEPKDSTKIIGAILGVGVKRKKTAIAIFVYPSEK